MSEDAVFPASRQNHWYTHVGDFINTLKAFIGINYQGLPFAFGQAGLAFGLVGVFVIATLTDHCCQLLVSSKMYLIDRLCAESALASKLGGAAEQRAVRERLEHSMGYGDVGRLAFGTWCFRLIQVAVWLTQFIILIIYFIFIGNTARELFPLRAPPLSNCTNHTDQSAYGVLSYPYAIESGGCRDVIASDDVIARRSASAFFHITSVAAADQRVHYFSQSRTDDGGKNYARFSEEKYSDRIFAASEAAAKDDGVNCTAAKTAASSYYSDRAEVRDVIKFVQSEALSSDDDEKLTAEEDSDDDAAKSSGPDLRLVVLFPIPFFILTSMVRDVRRLAPFSVIATGGLAVGAVSVAVLLSIGFTKTCDYVLVSKDFTTIPIFLTMMISSYEGIGCILPIHSSMVGARHLFPAYLHACVYLIFVVLCTFGTIGYLRYGSTVAQIIVQNMEQHTPVMICIDVTLIISVLFTYPLQCFPFIEITERFLFSQNWVETCRCCLLRSDDRGQTGVEEADGGETGRLLNPSPPPSHTADFLALATEGSSAASLLAEKKVAPWKRNVTRIILTLVVAGLAVLLKDNFAYLGSFSGAIGASLLAFILPCCIDIKLRYAEMSKACLIKDVCIIVFAVICSILGLYSIGKTFVPTKDHHHLPANVTTPRP